MRAHPSGPCPGPSRQSQPHGRSLSTFGLAAGSAFVVAAAFGFAPITRAAHGVRHHHEGHEPRGEKLTSAPPEAEAVLHTARESNVVARTDEIVNPIYASLAGAVDEGHLMATLATLTGFGTRYTSTPQYANAAALMRDRFVSYGLDDVSLFNFSCCGGVRQNVVGIKYGTTHPDEIVIIGGHLDSISENPTNNAPGAEDNGTGSAAVVELARLLANVETERTIHFLLFGGEEQGLYGSEAYAARADAENWDIAGVIIFDMVGYYDPAGADLWVEGFNTGNNSAWLVDLVRRHAQTYAGLSVYTYPGNGWGSDHEPFHDHGFPAMLSIENEWDDYSCYHRSCDTIDHITGSFLRKIAAVNGTAALELAGPGFTPASISGSVDLMGADDSGATVTVLGSAYAPRVTTTNGSYRHEPILPGSYEVRAECPGYDPQTATVELSSGEELDLDFALVPEASDTSTGGGGPSALLTVGPARPSPFTSATSLAYTLAGSARVALRIVDAQGRIVATLLDDTREAGVHAATWDGTRSNGTLAPAGVYWAEFRARSGDHEVLERTQIVRVR